MTTTIGPGIDRRENGTPPPEVPLADIDLGSLEFWSRDDDLRDGAFATLRREAPITFFEAPVLEGFEAGPGHWALTSFDDVHFASRHPEIFSSVPTSVSLAQIDPAVAEFARLDDQPRRSAAPAAALDRQSGLHPEDGGPHRRQRPHPGAAVGRRHGVRPSRRAGRLRRVAVGSASAADHLRHDGHPRRGRARCLSLDDGVARRGRQRGRRRPRHHHQGGPGSRPSTARSWPNPVAPIRATT